MRSLLDMASAGVQLRSIVAAGTVPFVRTMSQDAVNILLSLCPFVLRGSFFDGGGCFGLILFLRGKYVVWPSHQPGRPGRIVHTRTWPFTVHCPPVAALSQQQGLIGRCLDLGAQGVICPMINTPEEAEELVAACRYPPNGARSWGPVCECPVCY